jgi:nucleotide-binding universal stress UspA family protein
MFKRILVPTDGSDVTRKATETAIGLAQLLGAEIYTISVKEPFPYGALAELQPTPPQAFFDMQESNAMRHVQAVEVACQAAGVPCRGATVDGVHPWEAIIEFATENGCDLLVMGSHGRSGFSALLLGSETQDVLAHAKVPVLVVRD